MELLEQRKAEEDDSVKHISTFDAAQPSANHGLLSIKTLQPWHIPEHCLVSACHKHFQCCLFFWCWNRTCRNV